MALLVLFVFAAIGNWLEDWWAYIALIVLFVFAVIGDWFEDRWLWTHKCRGRLWWRWK